LKDSTLSWQLFPPVTLKDSGQFFLFVRASFFNPAVGFTPHWVRLELLDCAVTKKLFFFLPFFCFSQSCFSQHFDWPLPPPADTTSFLLCPLPGPLSLLCLLFEYLSFRFFRLNFPFPLRILTGHFVLVFVCPNPFSPFFLPPPRMTLNLLLLTLSPIIPFTLSG